MQLGLRSGGVQVASLPAAVTVALMDGWQQVQPQLARNGATVALVSSTAPGADSRK